jgi:hypothetical protein
MGQGAERLPLNANAGEFQLDEARLSKAFSRSWPDLETFIKSVPPAPTATPTRSSDSMAAETLEIVRGLKLEFAGLASTVAELEAESENFLSVAPTPRHAPVLGHPIDDPNGYIVNHYKDMSNRELARATGLSDHTIRRKLQERGLFRKTKDSATPPKPT